MPHRHAQTDPQTQKQIITTADSILIYGSEDLLYRYSPIFHSFVVQSQTTDRAEQQTPCVKKCSCTDADTDAHSFSLVLNPFPSKQKYFFRQSFFSFPLCETPTAFADLWFMMFFVA